MDKINILLVEDNPDDQMLLLRAFSKNNIANKIVVTNDGSEAIEYLFGTGQYSGRNINDLPQVILLDLNLPKVDGFEVLKKIRGEKLTKDIPVVVLTSSSESRDLVKSYNYGANSFVQKPVDFDEFIEAARQLGLYWLLLNRTVQDH